MAFPLFKKRYSNIEDVYERGKQLTDLLNTEEAIGKAVIEEF